MNRNFISVVLVLLLCVVGFGFYRGWFAVSKSSPDAGSNKVNINLTVDPDKMQADAETVKEKTTELTGTAKEEAKEPVREETTEFTGQAKEDAKKPNDQATDSK